MLTAHQYFLRAMKAEAYTRKEWFISVFSVSESTAIKEEIPYLLRKDEQGFYYLDDGLVVRVAEGAPTDQPLLRFKEPIHITPEDVATVLSPTDTHVGIVIWNYLSFIDPFKGRIGYHNQTFSGGLLKSIYKKGCLPRDDDPRRNEPGFFTPTEMLQSVKNGYFLGGMTSLCVPTTSRKALTINPAIIKRRDELFELHKDQLTDPVTMAKIQDELVAMDKADFKGDVAEDFFISEKFFSTARKKMFISFGLEPDFNNAGEGKVVKNSLLEGWDPKDLPPLANSAIDGSYDRGKSTAEGGAAVKELIRITQNIQIVDEDCGTQVGFWETLTAANIDRFVGSYYFDNKKQTHLITSDNKGELVGQRVMIRSPDYCRMGFTDYCQYCAGAHNSQNRVGMSASVVKMATKWMLLRMKKMHVSSLKVREYKLEDVFY